MTYVYHGVFKEIGILIKETKNTITIEMPDGVELTLYAKKSINGIRNATCLVFMEI